MCQALRSMLYMHISQDPQHDSMRQDDNILISEVRSLRA